MLRNELSLNVQKTRTIISFLGKGVFSFFDFIALTGGENQIPDNRNPPEPERNRGMDLTR